MTVKNTQDKLRELARCIAEPIPVHLSEKIRKNIPTRLHHRWGKDAVNIIIHLRISRLTAFIVIVLTLLICWFSFGTHSADEGSLSAHFLMLMELLPTAGTESATLKAYESTYQRLVEDGYESVYYGNIAELDDPSDIMLYWRLGEDRYRVIFADGHSPGIIDTEALLQFHELFIRNQAKKR